MKQIKAEIMKKIDALHDQAIEISDEYWVNHTTQNEIRKNDSKQQSYLLPCVRRKSDFSVEITWRKTFYTKNTKTSKYQLRSKHLNKGKTPSYSILTLQKKAPGWEMDWIERTETKFTHIRKQLAILTKIGIYVRQIEKLEREWAEKSSSHDAFDHVEFD